MRTTIISIDLSSRIDLRHRRKPLNQHPVIEDIAQAIYSKGLLLRTSVPCWAIQRSPLTSRYGSSESRPS